MSLMIFLRDYHFSKLKIYLIVLIAKSLIIWIMKKRKNMDILNFHFKIILVNFIHNEFHLNVLIMIYT